MFGRSKKPSTPFLDPMRTADIARVVDIIDQTDEDDAEEAKEAFEKHGTNGMFVLRENKNILGVTGFQPSEASEQVVWLSYTYLDEAYRGQNFGKQMLSKLLELLNNNQVRKIFIATSDYIEDGDEIYGDAHRFYEGLGAIQEVVLKDFYAEGESKLIYGLVNPEMASNEELPSVFPDGLSIDGMAADGDSNDVAALSWSETSGGVTGLREALLEAREQQFRLAVLALPSDISAFASSALIDAGFSNSGELLDFYAAGSNQTWWIRSFGS
ncbi:MAG: GNAT family N-acetyltransferase [Hyphomonas sp.]